jgi:hypothetical protein
VSGVDAHLVGTVGAQNVIRGTDAVTGLAMTLRAGDGTTGSGGALTIRGGNNTTTSGTGGAVSVTAGNGVTTGAALTLAGGTGATNGGALILRTAATTTLTTRMTIDAAAGHVTPGTDNTQNMGSGALRWKEIFAGTGTINTSDENLKEQITSLSVAELAVATAAKGLLKKYKFKDAVLLKGAGARWHIGVIAQDLQDAFTAEGLNAASYGMFCSDTWWELNGSIYHTVDDIVVLVDENTVGAVEVTQLAIRYEELLAFIIAAL